MKLLFDQGTPVPLRDHLQGHSVETAYEKGWNGLTNGDLLDRAEAEGFDAMVTTDQNLRYQQNLAGRTIGIIVLGTTNWIRIRDKSILVIRALASLSDENYQEIDFS